jgi:hypothetical protein
MSTQEKQPGRHEINLNMMTSATRIGLAKVKPRLALPEAV